MKRVPNRTEHATLFAPEGALQRILPEAIRTELTLLLSQLLLSVVKGSESPAENKEEGTNE